MGVYLRKVLLPSDNSSRPTNKPLSCRNNLKINEEQFNGNQNSAKQTNQQSTLTSEQRRNIPHPDDVIIPDQDIIIRHGQAKYKVKNHGSDFDLPSNFETKRKRLVVCRWSILLL